MVEGGSWTEKTRGGRTGKGQKGEAGLVRVQGGGPTGNKGKFLNGLGPQRK